MLLTIILTLLFCALVTATMAVRQSPCVFFATPFCRKLQSIFVGCCTYIL